MELIRISDRKLKIMLTASDMSHFEMNAERLGENTEQMRRSFRMLMKEVRRKIAFELDDRRVSVQYFPSREGGCEMFVSCSLQEEEQKKVLPILSGSKLPVKPAREPEKRQKETAYQMETLQDLLHACQRLQINSFPGESKAYKSDCGQYVLLLRFLTECPFSLPAEITFLSEYGKLCNTEQTKLYILEHANLISDRAVEELSRLA